MDNDEYLKKNGISDSFSGISPEHKRVARIDDETEYFSEYFRTGLDVVIEDLDYHLNRVLFDVILEEARKFEDVFEPMCQSGIFGCYIASEFGGSYKGLDIDRFGIEKAKERAGLNGLDPNIFVLGDVFEYDQEHEAIIGRYIVNGRFFDINEEAMDLLSRTTKNVVILQPTQAHCFREGVELYKQAFERQGYNFEVIGEELWSNATGALVFPLKATK